MYTSYSMLFRSWGFCGAFLLLLPIAGVADDSRWERHRAELERELKPGQQRDFYAQKLGEMGYAITAINAYEEEYVEYEIVKDDLSYEIQIDLNEATDQAFAVEVDSNTYQTAATEWELERYQRAREAQQEVKQSVTDQEWERQAAQLKGALKLGEPRRFYRKTLKELGYQLTAVNAQGADYVEYEVIKDGRSYEVKISLNAETGRATAIDIDGNWWQADTTETALAAEAEEQDQGSLEERWERGKAQLEQALAAGQDRDQYLAQLAAQGYLVTAVNYNDADYLEYEVIKNDLTYEVQIDVDPDTHEATQVAVVANAWQAAATEQALARQAKLPPQAKADARQRTHPIMRAAQYSDRDRTLMQQMIVELETLPMDKQQSFYSKALSERDYRVIRTSVDTDEKYSLEVGKDGRGLALHVFFDPQTGKSTRIDAVPLWWNTVAIEEGKVVNNANALGADWSMLPQDQTSLLLFREAYHPGEPVTGQPDRDALQQRVDKVFERIMLTQPHHTVTVSVREDGGVVLDGTVGSLGAALAAYEAVGKAEHTRYVVVDLDIVGSKAHQARIRQTPEQSAQPVEPQQNQSQSAS